jgi:hypothetical protein
MVVRLIVYNLEVNVAERFRHVFLDDSKSKIKTRHSSISNHKCPIMLRMH